MTNNLKDTQSQLKEEQEKFKTIFYESESPMVIYQGPEFIFEMFNEKYHEIYQNRELIGKRLLDAIPELKDTKFPGVLKQVYETGEHYVSHEGKSSLFNILTNTYETRYFNTTFSRINYGEGKPYRILATPREVTDKVLSRIKLEESLIALQQERELSDKFISSLSHDLRTPLAIAKMAANFLTMKNADPDDVINMATKITSSLDRADRMIRDLLDVSRIKAGVGVPISLNNCRLDLIVEHVLDDLKELFGERFKLINNVGVCEGSWDDMAIHRMMENLVINAIKYGSPETLVTITLSLEQDYVVISVHNSGNPISVEDQKNLFSHYSRSKTAEGSGHVGWGLGLALVKGLVEAHKGEVCVESHPGSGTTFKIKLPHCHKKTES